MSRQTFLDCFQRGHKMAKNTQHRLDQLRPPRVQITYDVEAGDAKESKELPFVVGVIADLSGHDAPENVRLKDKKFVEIDQDNFNDIMASINPKLSLEITDSMDAKTVNLSFSHMDDFSPLNLVKQVPDLAKLYESRCLLKDLLTKLDGNDRLEELLQEVIHSAKYQHDLRQELNVLE
jgi:type VI secretion system protein ImpB